MSGTRRATGSAMCEKKKSLFLERLPVPAGAVRDFTADDALPRSLGREGGGAGGGGEGGEGRGGEGRERGTNSAQLLGGGVEERDDVTAPVLLISGRGWRSWGSSRGRVGVVARLPPPLTVRCDAKLKEKQRSRIGSVFFSAFLKAC